MRKRHHLYACVITCQSTLKAPTPQLHLTYTSPTPHLAYTSPTPHLHLTHTSPTAHLYLTYTSPTPHIHLTYTSPTPHSLTTYHTPALRPSNICTTIVIRSSSRNSMICTESVPILAISPNYRLCDVLGVYFYVICGPIRARSRISKFLSITWCFDYS